MKRLSRPLIGILVLTILLLSCRTLSGVPQSPPPTSAPTDVIFPTLPAPVLMPPNVDRVSLQESLVELYEKVNPGVVAIRVLSLGGGTQGSGFVIDQEGHILTNYHVIEGVEDLEIAFSSGIKVRGVVLGTDLDSDIAVIKVELPAEQLQPLKLGDSDQVKVGQTVIAIGNPFGFRGTMTVGIVSGLTRTIQSLHSAPGGGTFTAGDIIQTDASINPGNSGGPLLNLNGEVIGINRAIFTTSFTGAGEPLNTGLGFAVSINIVKRVVPSLIADGQYDYPYVGITSLDDLSLLSQEALDLPRATGVYVTRVVEGSPADTAGLVGGTRTTEISNLQAGGDLIIKVDNVEVLNFADFISYLIKYKSPGDTVVLSVLRNNREIQISLVLDKRPSP